MSGENLLEIRENVNRRKLIAASFAVVGLMTIFVAVFILLALTIQMVIQGAPRLSPQFFTSFPSSKPQEAGILSAWVGTSLVMLVTAVVGVPLGIAAGIYLEEYARKNWLADLIEINVTNLAGVPSIIYGLLALGLFASQLKLGDSIATAGITLALLILPVVIVTTREALRFLSRFMKMLPMV